MELEQAVTTDCQPYAYRLRRLPAGHGETVYRGARTYSRSRPTRLTAQCTIADCGYDHDCYRRRLRARGISPQIARRGTPHGSGLGTQRWVVERTIAWLHGFRRLLVPCSLWR